MNRLYNTLEIAGNKNKLYLFYFSQIVHSPRINRVLHQFYNYKSKLTERIAL